MIRKLLTFSRKAELVLERVDMADVVRDTTSLLRRFLPETKARKEALGAKRAALG